MSSKRTREKKDRGLPFFGVGKILPFVKPYRRTIIAMVICGLLGCVQDIGGQQINLLREQADQQFDGRIDDCSIMFYGVCAGCLSEEQSSNYSQLETGQI